MKNIKNRIFIVLILTFVLAFIIVATGCNKSDYAFNDGNQNIPSIDNDFSQESSQTGNIFDQFASDKALYIQSKVDGLNIRLSPSTNNLSLGSINKGDMLTLLDKQGNWYKTLYKNQIAFVSANSSYTAIYPLTKGNETIERIIDVGVKYLGTKYVYGAIRLHSGNGTFINGFTDTQFDCSSYVQFMYYFGGDILLNMTTRTQYNQGVSVSKSELTRGDLMFFTNASRYNKVGAERIGHVAVYLGDNYILHTASDYAVIEQISLTRWGYLTNIQRHFN